MTKQLNIAEAKARLSQLLEDVAAGEDVVIARSGRPVARLVAIEEPPARTLGFLPIALDDALFAPLTGDELTGWE